MGRPIWLDEYGHCVPPRKCARSGCGREYLVGRYRYDTLRQIGWPLYRVALRRMVRPRARVDPCPG